MKRRSWCAAAVAAASVGSVVSGCGGDSGNAGKSNGVPAASHTATQASRVGSNGHQKESAGRREPGRASRKPPQGLPAGDRRSIARAEAAIVLRGFGFSAPTLRVSPDGSQIQASVRAADACSAASGTEGSVAARIRLFASFVRSVRITVAPTGTSLAQYVSRNCGGADLPNGHGPILLTQRGSNFGTTKSFTVRSSRWTVEYVNQGKFLLVIPLKGATAANGGTFKVSKPGSGRHLMTGAGTLRLRIGGTGAWVVRVRDGA